MSHETEDRARFNHERVAQSLDAFPRRVPPDSVNENICVEQVGNGRGGHATRTGHVLREVRQSCVDFLIRFITGPFSDQHVL